MTALLNRSGIGQIGCFRQAVFAQFDGQASVSRPAAMNVMVLLSFQAASVADDDKLLGEVRTKHIEGKARPHTIGVINGDEGMVVDIRLHAVALKIDKVHSLTSARVNALGPGLGEQIDQVKIVTALFHQGATTQARKFVPLIHLIEKRRPILAHAHGFDLP